jgi:putative PIN family toxin of toxin-antitoxin system
VRVVVDTNVFVSGLINPRGAPGAVVDAVIEGRITPVFGSETLAELQDVLARPRLQRFLSRAAIRPEALLARLALIADLVTPGTVAEHIRDPKDAPFVALATTRPAPDDVRQPFPPFVVPRVTGDTALLIRQERCQH